MLVRSLVVGMLFGFICCLPAGASVSGAKKQVIVFETMPVPVILEGSEVFRKAMADLGYRTGIDIEYRILKAEGDKQKGQKLLADAIARQRPDLVVTLATMASIIAHEQLKDTDIPWLFFTVTDPVGAGIIAAEGQATRRNVSGRIYGIDRSVKLDMVYRLVSETMSGRPLRIGFIHTDYPSSMGDLRMIQQAVAGRSEFALVPYRITYEPVPERLEALLNKVRTATRELEDKVDFWWSPTGPLGERDEYAVLLVKETRKPLLMATNLRGVKAGGLLYLGPDVPGQAREVAALADRVLKGEKVGDLPVTMPKAFNVGLNLKTAEALGLVIPSGILDLAGENLFR